MHDRISMSFLLASYKAGDLALAKKVTTSVRKDLNEQLRYYKMFGEQTTTEQMAVDAMSYLQNKPSGLTDKQAAFAQDIYSSYQMLLNMDQWEKQFGVAPSAGIESNQVIKSNDSGSPSPPKKDSPKKR